MISSELEPREKKRTTDFNLCLKCQEDLYEKSLLQPLSVPDNPETYTIFLDKILIRSHYRNPEFVALQGRLEGLTCEYLKSKKAGWHRSCYSYVTHKQHTDWCHPAFLDLRYSDVNPSSLPCNVTNSGFL